MAPIREHGARHIATSAACCLLLVALGADARAQPPGAYAAGTGTLHGHVTSAEGRRVSVVIILPSTPEFVSPRRFGAEVADDGTFELSGLPVGRHTLLVRAYFCDAIEVPVRVDAGEENSVVIELPCRKIPCPDPDKADPGCILEDTGQRERVGTWCKAHPWNRLRADLVRIQHGIMGCGDYDATRYPNASVCYSGGCVVGREQWARVAYCEDCRKMFYLANPLHVFVPMLNLFHRR